MQTTVDFSLWSTYLMYFNWLSHLSINVESLKLTKISDLNHMKCMYCIKNYHHRIKIDPYWSLALGFYQIIMICILGVLMANDSDTQVSLLFFKVFPQLLHLNFILIKTIKVNFKVLIFYLIDNENAISKPNWWRNAQFIKATNHQARSKWSDKQSVLQQIIHFYVW